MICARCKTEITGLKDGWTKCPKCSLPIYQHEGHTTEDLKKDKEQKKLDLEVKETEE